MKLNPTMKSRYKQAVAIIICITVFISSFVGCKKNPTTSVSSDNSSIVTEVSSQENTSAEDTASSDDSQRQESTNTVETKTESKTESEEEISDYFSETNSSVEAEEDVLESEPVKWVNPAPDIPRTQQIVSKVVNNGDKYYVEHLGKPYLNYGVQIVKRAPYVTTDAQWEEFYAKSAEIEFKNVLVQLSWSDIEPTKNNYNMYAVQHIIDMAEKYNLNIEILWFGINVCGVSNAPTYINQDKKTYPMINNSERTVDYSNKLLLERETLVLKQVMNYLYDNDKNRRVTMMQILNEPNFSSEAYEQEAFYEYINQLGLTVKNSPYSIVTRVNLVINDEYLSSENKIPNKILALKGIDMLGPDVYTKDIPYYGKFTNRFTSEDMSTNVMHFAEGPGQMEHYLKQVLYSFMNNSGYDVYELKSYGNVDFDFGIFRSDIKEWVYRDGTKKVQHQWGRGDYVAESKTTDIITLNKMINSVREQIASCPKGQFKMIFRRQSDKIGDQKITFVTYEERTANRIGAIFLAEDGYYYFFTPSKEGYFQFDGKVIDGDVSIGSFVNGAWSHSKTVTVKDGNKVNVNAGNVYRFAKSQLK